MRPKTLVAVPDNRSEINANMKLAKKFIEKGKYAQAKKNLTRVLELDPNHAEAQQLLEVCNQHLEELMAAELNELNQAVSAGTEQALLDFITQHPNSELIPQAQLYIADFQLWDAARQANTKEAYQNYLSQSTAQGYKAEAEAAIRAFEQEDDWNECHNSYSISLLQQFLDNYPESAHANDAQFELHLTQAEIFYDNKQYDMALRHYAAADRIHQLSNESNQTYYEHYWDILSAKQFESLKTSNDLDALRQFLGTLSSTSPYYAPTSNRIATVLADQLTSSSTESDYQTALSYATDKPTENYVNGKINMAKKAARGKMRAERKQRRSQARANFFGDVLGVAGEIWSASSIGWSIVDCYIGDEYFSAETGLNLRIGQYNHIVNLLVGANMQYFIPMDVLNDPYYYLGDYESFWKLAIPASLRLNIGDLFYLGCGVIYWPNTSTNSYNPTWAIEPQIGLCGPHMEIGINLRLFNNTDDFSPYHTTVGPMIGYHIAVNF